MVAGRSFVESPGVHRCIASFISRIAKLLTCVYVEDPKVYVIYSLWGIDEMAFGLTIIHNRGNVRYRKPGSRLTVSG